MSDLDFMVRASTDTAHQTERHLNQQHRLVWRDHSGDAARCWVEQGIDVDGTRIAVATRSHFSADMIPANHAGFAIIRRPWPREAA